MENEEGMDKRVASLVSLLFDPRVEIPLMLAAAVSVAYRNGVAWQFLALLLVVDVFLPAVLFVYFLGTGRISDWDVKRREERVLWYGLSMAAHLLGVGLAWVFGEINLALILALFWVLGVMFTLVTTKWKISLHGGVNSALAAFINQASDWSYGWLYLIVMLVVWARVRLKRHSWWQAVVGAVVGSVVVIGGMRCLAFWGWI
jgi:hypothetical protein